jgi:hypothetical protein
MQSRAVNQSVNLKQVKISRRSSRKADFDVIADASYSLQSPAKDA